MSGAPVLYEETYAPPGWFWAVAVGVTVVVEVLVALLAFGGPDPQARTVDDAIFAVGFLLPIATFLRNRRTAVRVDADGLTVVQRGKARRFPATEIAKAYPAEGRTGYNGGIFWISELGPDGTPRNQMRGETAIPWFVTWFYPAAGMAIDFRTRRPLYIPSRNPDRLRDALRSLTP